MRRTSFPSQLHPPHAWHPRIGSLAGALPPENKPGDFSGSPGGRPAVAWLPAGGGSPLDIHTSHNPLVFNHTLLGLPQAITGTTEPDAFLGLCGAGICTATASAPLEELLILGLQGAGFRLYEVLAVRVLKTE